MADHVAGLVDEAERGRLADKERHAGGRDPDQQRLLRMERRKGTPEQKGTGCQHQFSA